MPKKLQALQSAPSQDDKRDSKVLNLVKKAQSPNERTLRCNTPETWALYELTVSTDAVMAKLRRGLVTSIPVQDGVAVLQAVNKALIGLESAIQEAAKLTQTKWYKTSKAIESLKKQFPN